MPYRRLRLAICAAFLACTPLQAAPLLAAEDTLAAVPPDMKEDAEKALNLEVLKKLGIGKPGANGSIEVDLNHRERRRIVTGRRFRRLHRTGT